MYVNVLELQLIIINSSIYTVGHLATLAVLYV